MDTVWSSCSSLTPIRALQGGWCLLIFFKSQSHISPPYLPTFCVSVPGSRCFKLEGCIRGFSLQRSSQLPPPKSLLQRCCWCSSKAVFLVVLHVDVGVSTKELCRANLIANDSKSVATEKQKQEWELLWLLRGLERKEGPDKSLRTVYQFQYFRNPNNDGCLFLSYSGINTDV